MYQNSKGLWEIFFQTQKFKVNLISQWLQQSPKPAAALGVCRGRASVRSVASSMKALKATCTNTRRKWMMNWFATSACSPSSDPWTPLVATPIASIVWVIFWRSRTSAQWTVSGFSCTSAVHPACWSGTYWTNWLWCAPIVLNASRRCSAVNCSLTCTTGKIRSETEDNSQKFLDARSEAPSSCQINKHLKSILDLKSEWFVVKKQRTERLVGINSDKTKFRYKQQIRSLQ